MKSQPNLTSKIILASSSPYRKQQLEQLNLTFSCTTPNINETPLPKESANDLALRLSYTKAKTISEKFPNHIVIGCDQTAGLNECILGKPGNHEKAVKQLLSMQGQIVTFYSGISVIHKGKDFRHTSTIKTEVELRTLAVEHIENYLLIEQPYDCAGSFKCEGLGISLFSRITSDDPSALIGTPLIQLSKILSELDQDPLLTQK